MGIAKATSNSPQNSVGICISQPYDHDFLNDMSGRGSTTEMRSPKILLGNQNGPKCIS